MNAPTDTFARRSRQLAIIVYTWRSCFPPKRRAVVLLPCFGALLFGLLARAVSDGPDRAFANVAAEGLFGLVMPIAALVIGDSVLGAEIRAGSFHFTPGQAYEEGGNGNKSAVHWDMVNIQRPEYGGGEIWFDGKLIRKDGLFTLPALKKLNPDQLLRV